MSGIPGTKRKKWYRSETFLEAFGVGPPLLAALVGTIGFWRDASKPLSLAYMTLGGMVWLFFFSAARISRARHKDKEQADIESPQDLLGCAHVLHGLICQRCGINDNNSARLRVTIHRVVPPENKQLAPEWLEQSIPYVGDKGGEAGRRFSIKSGVIGQTARKNVPHTMSWNGSDPQGFIRQLVTEYNYTQQEAEYFVNFRRAWLAVPLAGKTPQETIGVIYLDAGDENLFSPEVRALVFEASFGIANYICERYR